MWDWKQRSQDNVSSRYFFFFLFFCEAWLRNSFLSVHLFFLDVRLKISGPTSPQLVTSSWTFWLHFFFILISDSTIKNHSSPQKRRPHFKVQVNMLAARPQETGCVKVAPNHSFVAESLREETPVFADMRPQIRTALLFFLSFAAVASAKLVILTISEQLIKIHERVVLLVLKTVVTAAYALIIRSTDMTGSEQGQGENRRPCVRACARAPVCLNLPILITWGIPQECWIQTRHAINDVQYSQIAVREGSQVFRMVAKSLDPLFCLKFQRLLRFAHQNWIRRTIYGCWCLCQMCAHCTWSNISFFSFLFSFFLLQVWERLDQDEAPPVRHKRIGVNTCERRVLQLPRRRVWIPSSSRCYLSADKCQSNSRAWLPAPWSMRKTAPAELWVVSNRSCHPKGKKTGDESDRWAISHPVQSFGDRNPGAV